MVHFWDIYKFQKHRFTTEYAAIPEVGVGKFPVLQNGLMFQPTAIHALQEGAEYY